MNANHITAAEWNAVNPVGTRVMFAGRVAFTVAEAVARKDFTSGKERGGYVECREPGETSRYPTRISLCSLIPISANPARDTPKPIARGEYAAVAWSPVVSPDRDFTTGRVPTVSEARLILDRFVNAAVDNPGPKPNFSIPTRADQDDDTLMAAFIDWAKDRDLLATKLGQEWRADSARA